MTISLLIVAVLTFTCVALARAASPYVGPDDYGYSAYEIPANLRDISASGTVVPLDNNPTYPSDLDDQDEISAISIPFPFDFYGISYTQLYISSNGFITFTADTDAGCCSGRPLPQNDTWNNLIALFWEDLSRPEGNIRYQTLGTPGNREFVIGFYRVPHHYDHHHVTFELILHEASGDIELQYGEAPGDGGTHSVGIENADGTIGLQIDFGDISYSNQGFLITITHFFADFTVKKAEIEFKDEENKDKFKVKGRVVLDENSDGIDPVTEKVSITVGSVTLAIPAGSFEEKGSHFEFKGVIGGADVKMKIKQGDFDTFDFDVHAKDVDLSYTSNPTDIFLSVGLDRGSTQIRLKKKLEYKSGKDADGDD